MPQTVSETYPKHSSVLQRVAEIELSKVVSQKGEIRGKIEAFPGFRLLYFAYGLMFLHDHCSRRLRGVFPFER